MQNASMEPGDSRYRPFPETRWSLVIRVNEKENPDRLQLLSDLCQIYWPPVYAFIRSRNYSPHDAEDLTQGFFEQFLRLDGLSSTDPTRGKLRSFILASVRNFLSTEVRHASRQKRGGGVVHVSIDATAGESRCLQASLTDHLSPEKIFDRQWAITLLETAIERVSAEYQARGKEVVFHRLKSFISSSNPPTDSHKIAQDLGMSETALRVAIHRLRQRYAKALKETVRDTIDESEDVDAELKYLMSVFS
ncbi:MAG: sigma-70 family RNA polymerase sigma factor [Verrucomicrobiae bacterium]|nr:sigma-70 family RNA polymerase sigma factor [Verrucomicrobiae bacterium]MCB1093501.1 sigma-70 family RNA polymerase sigma factor [Verrucomicrobiae bacterium]